MKKNQSKALFDESDFPISFVRQSMMRATGADVDELAQKPLVAIVNSLTEFNPGHMHLGQLSARVKDGVHAAGGAPFEFNVPAPCDGITEGHEGMRYVLPQRELIADTIETHVRSMRFDAMVMIASCDKIIPGMIMAAARLDLPTIFLTGGPASFNIRFNAAYKGTISSGDYDELPLKMASSQGGTCGACEVMGTANTFQCLAEALGLTLPGTANIPAFHSDKLLAARHTGRRVVKMVEEGLTARQVMTEAALRNAVIMDLAIGGSTNSTLHLPAIAHELGISLPLSVFNEYNKKIPTLLSIAPNGCHGMVDLYMAGGVPAVMKRLAGDLDLAAINVAGQTLAQVVEEAQVLDEKVIRPRQAPYQPEGGTAILYGNLAPEGAVVKQSAVARQMHVFTGRARVFEAEASALAAFRAGMVKDGEVIVIRNEGPRGGPGMPETLAVTLALIETGLKRVAMVTDGRFSGATSGPCIGHVSPEAAVGGPIAAVRDGDEITIDIPGRSISVSLSPAEIESRLTSHAPPARRIPPGYSRRYAALVSSAALGAVLKV